MSVPDAQQQKQARIRKIAQDLQRLRQMRSPRPVAGEAGEAGEGGRGYRFLRMIGEGAMSRVYLAKRNADGATLVLKILDTRRRKDDVLVKRFVREAKLISDLRSRYVVRIYDQGFTDDYGYIAMEFFSRGDLRQRVKMGIPPQHALRHMDHLARGLAAIHSVGVVHRDLKPANLMFRSDDTLVLADFGISKQVNESSDEQLTMVGQVLGTPYYMSPEQGQGLKVDVRSDLYSAGIILYELMTQERPYRARTPSGIIYQHIHSDIPRLPVRLNALQNLINGLLAKSPDDRYQTAGELIRALQKYSVGKVGGSSR